MRGVEDLPILEEMGSPEWEADMTAFVNDVFSREYQGLLGGGDGIVVAYRNQDVRALMANQDVGNLPLEIASMAHRERLGADGGGGGWERFLANNVITMMPPLHGPARQLLTRQLARGKVATFEELADQVVQEIAEETIGSGAAELEFQREFAGRISARFWRKLIGLDAEEEEVAREMAEGMAGGIQFEYSTEEARAVDAAADRYMEVLSAAIIRELEREQIPMISEMSSELAEIDLPGRPENVGEALASNLFDGFHTIKAGITNVVYGLLSNPDVKRDIDADPDLVGKATKEGLRLNAPVGFTGRFTTAEVVLDDVTIPAGTPISMLWAVANRDPNVFPEPHSFQLERKTQPQTTFGGGLQICPGRHVAVMLAEAVVRAWCTGGIEIELREAGPWQRASLAHSLSSLQVTMSVPALSR